MQSGRHSQALATKVVPPRCVGLIERPRLLGLVTQVQAKRLTVIKAPAGFGKTSLAVAWADRLEKSRNSVAWFSIDADDDEPTRFLFYVSHALQRSCDGVGSAAIDLILETSLIRPHAIISTLINGLAEIDEEVCLFLEDYHWVNDPAIHDAIAFLLRHAPSHFHLVLVSRTEPPLSLAGLRARNQLLEIDASASRFDQEETRRFLEHEKLGSLHSADIKLLHERTEGWPAALRIVASTFLESGQDFGQYARQLSGTLRPIGDYLTEMLDGLPRDMSLFMLRTAILERFSASLCQAVTQTSSSRGLLESIATRQLLLVPLDQEGRWYRYHTLLATYLRQRLEAERGEETATLHRRASLWFASQEQWTEAVQHAIAAGDTEQAVTWIKNCAMELVKKGDLLTLLGWQRLFPMMGSQAELKLAIAWGMALAIRLEEALQLLDTIEVDVDDKHSPEAEVLKCECATIRSVAIALGDDSRSALTLAEDCLNRSNDPWTANVASNVVRFGHLKAGDLKRFYATPWIPYSLDEDRRNVFASVYRRCMQGLAEVQQIRLAAAERYYLDAVGLAEQHGGPYSVAAALPFSLLAHIRYEQGRIDEAEEMLLDRLPIVNATAMLECVLSAYFVLVRLAEVRMNFSRAHTLLEQAENLGLTRRWGRLVAVALCEQVRLSCREGRIAAGLACLERLERVAAAYPARKLCAWSDIHRYTAWARAQLASAQAQAQDAISILKDLQREADDTYSHYFALRIAVDLSATYLRANKRTDALAVFRKVLSVAAQADLHQTILDQGPEIDLLLAGVREEARRGEELPGLLPYIDNLFEGWHARYQPHLKPSSMSAIADPLSARESDILKLIAQGQSNKEIARSLAIAPETVKSHVKHIFIKLAVEKRAQAVSRAQSLGLVTTA
jgi:LuxR family transcriptional regulator, maltose regulon positive regulatory protein